MNFLKCACIDSDVVLSTVKGVKNFVVVPRYVVVPRPRHNVLQPVTP